ncbi:MAG: zinc-binding dehydrogenase [Pseudomonadota bacterium]|uniref:zinc-binding dehydrogenase n=1 Tax=Marinobacter sp. TaxID=50741 RepID=UPI002E8BB656|nr:zinc-binding dehydrogenase [Pseudomonadota bacterium]
MKALLLKGPQALTIESVPAPKPSTGEVVLDVEITGIGGSELAAIQDPGLRPLPNIMGHGLCGATSSGERVAVFPLSGCGRCDSCHQNRHQLCNEWSLIGVQRPGGFAEQVAVPESALITLPSVLSWEQASFIEPFANSVNAWERAQPKPTDSVLIIGAGSLGLGLAAAARHHGCASVAVSDPSPTRLEAALALGASEVARGFNTGFDVVFDTVGSEQSRTACLQRTRKGGKAVFLGFASQSLSVDFSRLIREQKTLIGSFVFSREQFMKAMELASGCHSDWVRNLSFDEVFAELQAYSNGNFEPVKSALRPQR